MAVWPAGSSASLSNQPVNKVFLEALNETSLVVVQPCGFTPGPRQACRRVLLYVTVILRFPWLLFRFGPK